MSVSASEIDIKPQRDLAKGVLLSWSGRPEESIRPLRLALQQRSLLSRMEAQEALRYLALAEGLTEQYGAAVKDAQQLLADQQILVGNDLSDFRDQAEGWKILKSAPRIRVEMYGPARMALIANASHRLEATVHSGQRSMVALFDTGAEMTAIRRSALQTIGIAPLPGGIHDTGSSGVVATTEVAILPELRMGTITVRNIPVLIEDDASMVGGTDAQRAPIDIIVGETVLRRLSSMGTSQPGMLSFNQAPPKLPRTAQLMEVGPTLLISAAASGDPCRLLLDTGATKTILTQSFYQAHLALFPESSKGSEKISGIGGSVTVSRFLLPEFNLTLLRGKATLHNLSVFVGNSALDVTGLGRDLWSGDGPFQINFKMHTLEF